MKTVMENQVGAPEATVEAARPATARGTSARVREAVARHRTAALVIGGVGLVALGQLVEDVDDGPPIQMLPPTFLIRRWTVVVAVLYMLVISRVVERTVERSLPALQAALRMNDATFRGYADRMRPPTIAVDLGLLGISLVGRHPAVPGPRLRPADPRPGHRGAALPSGGADRCAGRAGRLHRCRLGGADPRLRHRPAGPRPGRRFARAVRHRPIRHDEPAAVREHRARRRARPRRGDLHPAAGTRSAERVPQLDGPVGAASASILALLLPLRAIHRQMADAKEAALATLNERISQAYDEATGSPIDDRRSAASASGPARSSRCARRSRR